MTNLILNRRQALIGAAGLLSLSAPALAQAKDAMTYLYPAPGILPAFSPFAIAREKGYYAAEGLEINWQMGRGGVDVGKQLAAGNAQLGGGIGDTSIILRAQGANVKGVALLGGRTLTQIYARKDAGINSLADLKGKRVGVLAFQDTTYYNLLGVMRANNLKRDDVNVQAVGPAGIVQLMIAGQLDAISGVPEWAAGIEGANVPLTMFNIDAVFPAMAQAIMASDEMLKSRPETVKKFLRATLKALAEVRANPTESAKTYVKAVPEHAGKEAIMEGIMKRYNELVYATEAGATLGKFDAARVTKVQAFYKENAIIEKDSPVTDLFSNDFVG
jgi:NitT/TauT family transport system substrate-binding protein